jgi:hypothetical protein
VIRKTGSRLNQKIYWLCRCKCGKKKEIMGDKLRRGETKSCGCLRDEWAKAMGSVFPVFHGGNGTPELAAYRCMIARCHFKHHKQFYDYGARGIEVCPEWRHDFRVFLADMGKRPLGKFSLERIDNNKGYFKGNCKWATWTEQGRNKRNSRRITFNGKTLCLSAWAEVLKIKRATLESRLEDGFTVEEAFTIPIRRKGRKWRQRLKAWKLN